MNKMSVWIRDKNDSLLNWPKVLIVILLELFIVYTISNIPFILDALPTANSVHKEDVGFFGNFFSVLKTEVASGQLLTFVCTIIAPVVFWSILESQKTIVAKIFSFICLILLVLCVYVQVVDKEDLYVTGLQLYVFAVVLWMASVLANRIPPDPPKFTDLANTQTDRFVEATRGGGQ